MVGVLVVGFVANLLVRPVAERFHEPRRAAAEPAAVPPGAGERFTRGEREPARGTAAPR
jgi:hypothetical protein